MKRLAALVLVFALLTATAFAGTDVVEWVDFVGDVTINGEPAPVGTIVQAFDPDGIQCGEYIVGISPPGNGLAGVYGLMHVYNDDPEQPGDQGAVAGNTISFTVNGLAATTSGDAPTWTANGALKLVDLAVTTQAISFTVVEIPAQQAGAPGATLNFRVGIRNDGNGTDLYGVRSESDTSASPGWETTDQDTVSYADPNDTAFVRFSVYLPIWGGGIDDTVYMVHYTVFSHIDSTVSYSDSVEVLKSITDGEDGGWQILPDGFVLEQNYPNPFNPTTTIAFAIPASAEVRLSVYNILGQQVRSWEMGRLSAGEHQVEFDGASLSSGIYFYRLQANSFVRTRKMVLIK